MAPPLGTTCTSEPYTKEPPKSKIPPKRKRREEKKLTLMFLVYGSLVLACTRNPPYLKKLISEKVEGPIYEM